MDLKASSASALSVQPSEPDTTPIVIQPLPILTRINYALQVWAMKAFVTTALGVIRWIKASHFRAIAPTYTKRYPIRPTLESRVFLPKDYAPGTTLPLYIDIHGGGFTLCDPATDDEFCRYFADRFGYCVVSIDYRKAPSFPFPVPVHDCAELTRAVLADEDLPVDHKKVAIGGFSGGGNLCLAVAQFEDLRKKIAAVVPFYPVVDFTEKYRGKYQTTKDGRTDVLKNSGKLFSWSYIPAEIDRKDTLLSSIYAPRTKYPGHMYFVGAEYDVLCNEGNHMAKMLAGIEGKPDPGPAWSQNSIRWEMLHDQQHGFTHVERKGEEELQRKKLCDELYKRVDSWLKDEVFAG